MINIDELSDIRDIEDLSERYKEKYGSEVLNISWWDPSTEFNSKMIDILNLPIYEDPINYIFSYEVDQRSRLLRKMGFNNSRKSGLITNSGSVSILIAVHWLKSIGIKKIHVLCPYYFTLGHNCTRDGIEIEYVHMVKNNTGYRIPIEILEESSIEALWVTNPVYCTGNYLINEDIEYLRSLLLKNVTIIADECLAFNRKELSNKLGDYDSFMGIYAPHKTICVNGIKFSMIVFNKKYEDFFDQWADVYCGCLNPSNIIAIDHFLSPNFEVYQEQLINETRSVYDFLKTEVDKHQDINIDSDSVGYLTSCYFPNINAHLSKDIDFLWNVTKNTGTSFIPGLRNHFSPKVGFCFRVNLAMDSAQFRSSMIRLLRFLSTYNG